MAYVLSLPVIPLFPKVDQFALQLCILRDVLKTVKLVVSFRSPLFRAEEMSQQVKALVI